jgi:hypothetical protein
MKRDTRRTRADYEAVSRINSNGANAGSNLEIVHRAGILEKDKAASV